MVQEHNLELCDWLSDQVSQILKLAPRLNRIDRRTEKITNPLRRFSGGVVFRNFANGFNDAAFCPSYRDCRIILNQDMVWKIVKSVNQSDFKNQAVLLFLCHEVTHLGQRIPRHEDVRRMKSIDSAYGRERLSEIDLRSDFLAAHTVSLFMVLREQGEFNNERHIHWLYRVYCDVCEKMLYAFPPSDREDKLQRIFGFLLMSNLVCDAYTSNYPLEFKAELWPKWSKDLSKLAIYSEGEPLIHESSVEPSLMREILNLISLGKYQDAADSIRQVWSILPRR